MEKLFYRAGFEVDRIEVIPGPEHAAWVEAGRPADVPVGRLTVTGLATAQAEEFYAHRFYVSAKPRLPSYELTSIIVVTHNQLALTRKCVESVQFLTDEPYELVFVDNGSTDGTLDYLRTVSATCVIANPDNRGFPAAVNQGIEAARGEQILLLNNDTVVTTGWLRRMLEALWAGDDVMLVGPCSNNVSGPQQIPVCYEALTDLERFAWEHGRRNAGKRADVDRLVGFCLLFRRSLVEDVGQFDERFGIGCFEDDDFCRRAIQAGYRAVIARDSFIHHFGSQTFRALEADFGEIMRHNQALYGEKWNITKQDSPSNSPSKTIVSPARPSVFGLEKSPHGGLRLIRKRPQLSLCMIVRDNEETIGPCLESIRPWVDEMIVVDTGSGDRTPEICRQLGANVFQFPWCDDFSAARNVSLEHASGEWLFWIDSDDTIPADCGRGLRELAYGPHAPETLGYVMQVHCPGSDGQDVTVVDHVKLFRNRPDLRFEHRIHEQILPAIRRAAGEVEFTDLYVVHSGSDRSATGRMQKLERDFRILAQDLAERPEHPFVLFNLGMTHADAEQYPDAVNYLRRALAVSGPDESHVRKAYALLTHALAQLGRHAEAWICCEDGLSRFPDDIELKFRCGLLHQHFGRPQDAIGCYEDLLARAGERRFSSVDRGINGHKAHHNAAVLHEELGNEELAERHWRAAVAEAPGYREGWRGLWNSLQRQNQDVAMREVAKHLSGSTFPLCCEGLILQSELLVREDRPAAARLLLEEAVNRFPDDMGLNHALAQRYFECGDLAAAAGPLEELIRLSPGDPSVLHNLATVDIDAGRYEAALERLGESLRLRPDSHHTRQLYAQSLRLAGLQDNAADAQRRSGQVAGIFSDPLSVEAGG